MTRNATALAVLSACLLLGACKPASAPAAGARDGSAAPDARPASPAPDASRADAGVDAADTPPSTPATPALRVSTVDGGTFDLSAHRGQWVVVNFWATWCSPCLKEMPELSALDAMREYIDVVGLAYEDIESDAMRAFLKTHPVVYPVAIIDVTDPPKDFQTPRGLPMTYLVGPDGKVAKQFLGPVTASEIEAAIAAAGGPRAG